MADPVLYERELRTNYKLRIHVNFMKAVLDRNLGMFLQHIENLVDSDKVDLDLKDAKLIDVDLRIATPPSNDGSIDEDSDVVAAMEGFTSELFIDREEIVMEIDGLQLRGTAKLLEAGGDPAKAPEIKITAPLELSQFVLYPTQVLGGNETANDGDFLGQEGFIYPKLSVEDVALKMKVDEVRVQVQDDQMPLYKS